MMVLLISFLAGCVDVFTPPSPHVSYGYLVVDGFLNTGNDTSTIKLSRTQEVSDTSRTTFEAGARVFVEDQDGLALYFHDNGLGGYILPPGSASPGKNYRLHIFTRNGEEYSSSYVAARSTPSIDSISYHITSYQGKDGVRFFVNSHDSENSTSYYMWDYVETWEYTTRFNSSLERVGDTILDRTQQIYRCWRTVSSSTLLLASTTALQSDVVKEFPLTFVPKLSPRLSKRYSLLVHQYAITAEAYQYWLAVQKNTENVGTVFGPIPSRIDGNLRCLSNREQPVLGFFSASDRKSLRFFVSADKFELVNHYDDGMQDCHSYTQPLEWALYPTTDLYLFRRYAGRFIAGYEMIEAKCADCRLYGGIPVKPEFW